MKPTQKGGVPLKRGADTVKVRKPRAEDGEKIYKLVKEGGILDVNSEYAYQLLSEHFYNSCAVAEDCGEFAGFVFAYILPAKPNVLFVWQIAVAEKHRKKGIALAMMKDILAREACKSIDYIQAHITPSNHASRAFFTFLAKELKANHRERAGFSAKLFDYRHEEERLFTIGKIPSQEPKTSVA